MILPKCLVLVVGVFIGVAAVTESVYSRKRVENGVSTTETWTTNGQYWEYRKERAEGNSWRKTEVQRLALDGSFDIYVFGAGTEGTPYKYKVSEFRRLSQPADGSPGPFAENLTPSGFGGVAGGVASSGCTRGRFGSNCQLMAAVRQQVDETGPEDLVRRPRTKPWWRNTWISLEQPNL